MGYDIHITRRAFWADEDGPVISLEAWMAHCATDASLVAMPVRNEAGGIVMDDPSPGSVAYQLPNGEWWPMWWDEGGVLTKNPPVGTFAKLAEIAAAFQAQVQGDDGEQYDASGERIVATTPQPSGENSDNRSWLGRLFGRAP